HRAPRLSGAPGPVPREPPARTAAPPNPTSTTSARSLPSRRTAYPGERGTASRARPAPPNCTSADRAARAAKRGRPLSSAPPVIGVLALPGGVREHLHALEHAGARARGIRRPDELDSIDGLVVPGGESTTMWRLAVAFDLLEPLRERIASGLPAFGTCAGMIMLADR